MALAYIFLSYIHLIWLSLNKTALGSAGQCRNLIFSPTRKIDGKRLLNHVISVTDVTDKRFCQVLCFMEDNCFSCNIMKRNEKEERKCELNNATHEGNEHDLVEDIDYSYCTAENACASNPCSLEATCQTGFTNVGYRCLCPEGFTGQSCESDTNECSTGTHSCHAGAECINTVGSYECICKPGYHGDGRNCTVLSTCKEIFDISLYRENKAYIIRVGSEDIAVYCVLNSTSLGPCVGGGWTLAMKIDGSQQTFHYDSSLWSNKIEFNIVGGETGFDEYETKLPTYWNTSFSRICLGMKIPGEETPHFVALNQSADSLYSLIADQQYRQTSLGRGTWKSLLGLQGSLQHNCNREGFNVISDRPGHPKARIGIIGNNENACITCDSRIGFGTAGYPDDSNTCGIEARVAPDNGDRDIETMGYILIQ